MSQADVQERPVVTITEQAAEVIKAACAADPAPVNVVRFSAIREGDSIRHGLRLETEARPDDVVFEQHALTIAVSRDQVAILAGTELDYEGEGEAGRFVIVNPNLNR